MSIRGDRDFLHHIALLHRIDYVLAIDNLAKYGVLAVEVRLR